MARIKGFGILFISQNLTAMDGFEQSISVTGFDLAQILEYQSNENCIGWTDVAILRESPGKTHFHRKTVVAFIS
tara:strand:- start:171 stop:392 length:222 start_codon:yes stop_codon:yes gene_type:complete